MSTHKAGTQQQQTPVFKRWVRERIATLPLPEAEDSIRLRVLVQALVIVGIIATDVAAADAVEPLWVSLWAIPASIVGATWSWYHRRDRNITLKFGLAIGMLLVLAAFFARLLGALNDTRLVLAELLIQLQVLHSFDLPRRKDLGYSIVIGLILLAVAATLSQTFSFAPLLLVFLAIAFPVLMLDYRSRLGVIGKVSKLGLPRTGLSLQRLTIFLLITLGFGLIIFAALPRLPGYQLRTFPVSSTIELDGEFDSSRVVNPGYVSGGRGSGTDDAGAGGIRSGTMESLDGPGELDNTYYYGFNTRMNQNLRGQLEPKVVMRVRSQAKGFWRVLAFDRYLGQGWEISRNEQTQILERPRWSYRFWLPRIGALGKSKEIVQTYTVVADLPNLIPALAQPKYLYFPTREIGLDEEGGLRSPVELTEGLTYTVISEVPYRDRTALGQASTNYPKSIQDNYLQVPAGIVEPIRRHTAAVLAQSPKPTTNAYEKTLYLAQYLKQNYTLQPDLPFLAEDEDLVETFLFKSQGGYPDHFSTTLTIMLRSIGIPARLVTGFAPGEFNPFTGFYVVRNTDAYALTEVYFPQFGWFTFDPIPGHELVPPSIEDSYAFSALRQFWSWVAGWLPSPVRGLLGRLWATLQQIATRGLSWFLTLLTRGWVGLIQILLLAVGISLMGWLAWGRWQAWRYRRWLAKLPPMEGLYQQMLRWLAEQGFRKHPAQTPLEYAQLSRDRHPSEQAQVIREISQAYVEWRYGKRQPNLEYLRTRLHILQPNKTQWPWRSALNPWPNSQA